MRILAMICLLGTAAAAQDRHDWQSLAQLQTGEKIRVSLKTGPVEGPFTGWTPQQVTAGTVTAKKEDVLKVERYHGRSRGKSAALGALIGFGGGFAIGAGAFSCNHTQIGVCLTRGQGGAIVGGVGAVIGAGIGALLPAHRRELIYSLR